MKSVVVAAALCAISSVDAFGITSRGYVCYFFIYLSFFRVWHWRQQRVSFMKEEVMWWPFAIAIDWYWLPLLSIYVDI